jgi:hypothetical protein
LLELTHVSISGHETFPFRAGWLRKGFELAKQNPRGFIDQDEAMTHMGVGKNMVRSIRHWCLATRLLEERSIDGVKGLFPTSFGQKVIGQYDPYLEDASTLWLLHWKLATHPAKATTWYAIFSAWFQSDFTKDELVRFMNERLQETAHTGLADSSLRRDIDCFVRTYVPAKTTPTLLLEDALDCPLTELNLITELGDRKTYRLQRSNPPTLPDLILAYMIYEYWEQQSGGRESLSFEDLMYKPGSPGRVLRLEENAMTERLERMENLTKGAFSFTSSAGLKQLLRGWRPIDSPMDLLDDYYGCVQKG